MRAHIPLPGRRALAASLALCLVALAGCGDDGDATAGSGDAEPTATSSTTTASESEQDRLDQARERWDDAGLDDYELTWTVQCFCPRATFVDTVVDGEVVGHERAPGSGDGEDPGPKTVHDIFDEVQAAIDEEPEAIDVTYDDDTGAVVSWFADFRLDVADEERGLEVQLRPLDDAQ